MTTQPLNIVSPRNNSALDSAAIAPAVNLNHNPPATNTQASTFAARPVANHNRKGSLMVGGGVDIKRGNLAFGTVDSPNPLLSSSPATPSQTGAHLSDAVKSFGSIDADAGTDSSAVKASRRSSTLSPNPPASDVANPASGPKQLDIHAMFGAKAKQTTPSTDGKSPSTTQPNHLPNVAGSGSHDRRQSMNGGFQGGPNGIQAGTPHAYPGPHNGMNSTNYRPQVPLSALQSRSPTNGHVPLGSYGGVSSPQGQQNFRPMSNMQPNGMTQGHARPMMPQSMQQSLSRQGAMMSQPNVGAYGMHPGQHGAYGMMYPNQGYYDGYNAYTPQHYGMNPQWQQSQMQNQSFNPSSQPLSPPNQPSNGLQPSPQPRPTTLPSSSASPAPTPPSRPGSLMGHQPSMSNVSIPSLPSTPARSVIPPSTTPSVQSPPGQPSTPYNALSGGASSFTPRTSKAIKFSRPDGTAVDIKEAAAAAKGPVGPGSGSATPEPAPSEPAPVELPKKKVPTLPVMVRLESEEQKKARLAEEETRARFKAAEEKEERERQERKERERQAREEEELRAKTAQKEREDQDAKDKAASTAEAKKRADDDAEQKRLSEALAAEEAAAKKAKEEQEQAKTSTEAKPSLSEVQQVHSEKEEAREKAEEKGRALLTPETSSIPASPLASPALAAAGLPAKPAMPAAPAQRKIVPAALDLKATASPTISEEAPEASPSALSTARAIDDISSISYPKSLKSPRPELNVDAKPGKYRYDREFLMQFMHLCREKPENLPPLDEIGLEADASSGFGTSRSRGSRASQGPSSRGPPQGLGIANSGRPSFPAQGMGSFNMGSFGAGSLRGTTSEERYKHSLAQGRQGSMARTPSQGGLAHGLPAMGLSSSRSGTSRSQRGQKRLPQDPRGSIDPDVAPIVSSSNSWVKSRPTGNDEGSPAYIERKVKALLNKLTAEKFASISSQILEWANKSANESDGMTLKLVIKQIFEKATDEAHWSSMYARLCRLLLEQLDPAISEVLDGKPVSGGMLFRKYLVGRCQVDFEAGWKAREDAATAAAAKSEEDKERLAQHEKNKEEGSGEVAMLSDEYYVAQKAKRRGLGLVQLIGELYNLDMLGKGVIRQCFVKLLGNIETPDEEDIESACKLLTTVGKPFEAASHDNMDVVFDRLDVVLKGDAVASRIKFMIMDVIDLRKARWESKNKSAGVMTIAEVHQAAAREQAEKAAAAAQSARESISRGGSRAGHSRTAPGEWQSVAAGAKPLQRPTDFSNLGRNFSSAGMPTGPTFGGPASVFNKGRGKNASGSTPPLSRQASTTNMFSALRDEQGEQSAAGDRRGSGDATEALPQRKKLNLKPRSKPMPGENDDGEAEGEGEGEGDESDDAASEPETSDKPMTADGAKNKINSDMKELWGEKDQGGSRNPEDIVEYFKAIPSEHRHLLAQRLVDDVFRIAKIKDAEVVGKGWVEALGQDVVSKETLRKSIEKRMPELDEEAIDFPQAYTAIAILVKSIDCSEEEIKALADMVDLMGLVPKVTPQEKLSKAVDNLA